MRLTPGEHKVSRRRRQEACRRNSITDHDYPQTVDRSVVARSAAFEDKIHEHAHRIDARAATPGSFTAAEGRVDD
jgi:hypothetical protein